MLNDDKDGLSPEAPSSADATPDLAKYKEELAHLNMTEEQQEEFLRTLWDILSNLVHLKIDVASFDLCGQLLEGFNELAAPDSEAVDSVQTTSTEHLSEKKEKRDDN